MHIKKKQQKKHQSEQVNDSQLSGTQNKEMFKSYKVKCCLP